jgi:hypothetical protein
MTVRGIAYPIGCLERREIYAEATMYSHRGRDRVRSAQCSTAATGGTQQERPIERSDGGRQEDRSPEL